MPSGDKTTKISVFVDEGRCMHAHGAWAICARCVNACPAQAISYTQGRKAPEIDSEHCVSCGLCLSSCPLGAFSSHDFSERRLLDRIYPSGPVRLRCFLPYGELETLIQDWDSYHVSVCLAGLTPGALYNIALDRPCELATVHCVECKLFPKVERIMRENFEAARALLADCGRAGNLRESQPLLLPAYNEAETGVDGATAAVGGEAPTSNAHAKFAAIYRQIHKPSVKQRPTLPNRARHKHVPRWRIRLAKRWNEIAHRAEDGSYRWPVHHVDFDACRACGICMQLCPTGSIVQRFGEGVFSYSFTPGYCAECGLCLMSCPEGALSRTHGTYEQPFEEVCCLECAALPCPQCGLPAFSQRVDGSCRTCRAHVFDTPAGEDGNDGERSPDAS